MSGFATPRLRALLERAPAAEERCELCAGPLPAEHPHVHDRETRTLLCACAPCGILFDHGGSGGSRFRLVRSGARRLDDFRLDDAAWRAFGIPVEMTYFVRGDDGAVSAFYPSPAGAVGATIDLASWTDVELDNPALRTLVPDVEALLVRRRHGVADGWIVGIDSCYRLVALIRRDWRGFHGGEKVWNGINRFFEEL